MKYFYALILLFLVFGAKAQDTTDFTIFIEEIPFIGNYEATTKLYYVYRNQTNPHQITKDQDDEYNRIYLGKPSSLTSKSMPNVKLWHSYTKGVKTLGYYTYDKFKDQPVFNPLKQ